MRAIILATALFVGVAGCAGAQTPGAQAGVAESGFPDLHAVPRTTDANTDAAYWAQVEADLIAAGSAVRANPRAEPSATTGDASAFVEEARRDLEESRQSHEPN